MSSDVYGFDNTEGAIRENVRCGRNVHSVTSAFYRNFFMMKQSFARYKRPPPDDEQQWALAVQDVLRRWRIACAQDKQ